MHIYIYTCTRGIHTEAIIIKTSEDFFKKYTSHFIERVRKGSLKVFLWEGVGDWTELQYIDPHSYGHQRCVFLVLLMLNRRPGGPLCWLSLLYLITNSSSKLLGAPRAPSAVWWLSLPQLFLQLVWSPTPWLPVFTVLYNSSIAHSIFGMACLLVNKRK